MQWIRSGVGIVVVGNTAYCPHFRPSAPSHTAPATVSPLLQPASAFIAAQSLGATIVIARFPIALQLSSIEQSGAVAVDFGVGESVIDTQSAGSSIMNHELTLCIDSFHSRVTVLARSLPRVSDGRTEPTEQRLDYERNRNLKKSDY